MNVDVTFLGEKLDETLTIPTVAIVTRAGKTGVMVPNEDNQPAFQPVRIGLVLEEKNANSRGVKFRRTGFHRFTRNQTR